MEIKNIYTGEELKNILKEIINTKQATTIIFHDFYEDEFESEEDEILIDIEYDNDLYYITTNGITRTMSSDWVFEDYVFAICGW